MSSHALNPSIYQPLDNPSQEIRLLRMESPPKFSPELITPVTVVVALSSWLSPPPFHTRASIKCKLLTFKLDEAPPYKALSYTWGSPGYGGTIQVDGQHIPVGQNLFTAMQRLHQESWVEYLWVDALCINQGDDDEKSHQVPLMGQIYGQANSVLLMEMMLTEAELSNPTSTSGDSPRLEALVREKLESLSDDSNKQAVEQLFRNPYWTRVWVLQEFGHAASSVLICGRHIIDMSKINHFLFFWKMAFRFPFVLSEGPDWNDGVFSSFQEFLDVRAGTSTCQALRSEDSACPILPSWLPDFRKIGNLEFPYACPIFMAGFSHQHNFDASGLKNPCYSISDKHLTAKGFSLDKIRKTTQLPSSSDTFTMLNSIALSIGIHGWKQHDQTGIYRELYKAIFPTQLLIEPNNPFVMGSNPRLMLSLGLVSMKHYFSDKLSNQYAAMVREGRNMTTMEVLQFVTAEGSPALSYVFSAIYEDFIEDLIPDVSGGDDDTVTIRDQLYKKAATSFGTRITEEGSDTDEAYLIPFHENSDSSYALTLAKTFLDHTQYLWASRAFAITERGYMRFGEYLLVGDCCFEGMMLGEMVKKQEEGEFVLQDFTFK
ncbi:heterokaryon incompatibility protein-domain-containing protein [Fusarium solani]|uniref:Heterokaryon incompatibility protein-domain-containing protein n=1 Tax=Fusarium solani TaxID=169388 RepID=A0A9P9KUA1_FUSSL|nr:heterokaryon incompatibility protein-domain-containing protein [Fusarium solani]KAH7268800.1 heterokaryon incompatibility protein-domain-containing protein [Fusarium solani]